MTSRCTVHEKDTIGSCQWCGRKLCRLCIGGRKGMKLYCDACVKDMNDAKKGVEKIRPKGIW